MCMNEKPREFGKRRPERDQNAASVPEMRDFTKDRPMYERLRKNDAQMDELLTRYEGIVAAQEVGYGVHDDARERESVEKQIRERYEELNRGR
jgi:hypothetical protein